MQARFVDGLACVEALLRRAGRDVVAVVAKVVDLGGCRGFEGTLNVLIGLCHSKQRHEGRIHRISTRQYASRRVTLLLHA